MFAGLTEWIIGAIQTHGMLAVVLGVAIETVIVPIPSPVILMAAGFILVTAETVSQGFFQSLWISLIAGVAQTVGSYLVYGIAYLGGKPLIDRYQRFHGVSWDEIEEFKKGFEKEGKEEITLFLLRAIPVMPLSVVSGVAGIIQMDFRKFTAATFLGTIPRNLFLTLLGWQLAGAYGALAQQIDSIETLVTVILVFLIAGYILAHKFSRRIQKLLH